MASDSLPKVNIYLDEVIACLTRLRSQASLMQEAARRIAKAQSTCTIGVGKSAFVAQKMAASLRSIAIPADFVHAGEALHGDLGRIRSNDVVVIFSKSGNSEELKTLLPLLQKRSAHIIAVTNRKDSLIGTAAELLVDIGVRDEGDGLDLMPLISVDVSLVVADIIASQVADLTGLTPMKFRENHPGGQLGFSAGLTLRNLHSWKERKAFVQANTQVLDATLLMSKFRAGLVCVTDASGILLGILTDGDLRAALAKEANLHHMPVSRWMNTRPRTLRDTMAVAEALAELEFGERKVFAAPVLDAMDRCLGVITIHDLMR